EQECDQAQSQQEYQESGDHGRPASASDEPNRVKNPHRMDQDSQCGPPRKLCDVPHYDFFAERIARAISTAWAVGPTSCTRTICTPDSTAPLAQANEAG